MSQNEEYEDCLNKLRLNQRCGRVHTMRFLAASSSSASSPPSLFFSSSSAASSSSSSSQRHWEEGTTWPSGCDGASNSSCRRCHGPPASPQGPPPPRASPPPSLPTSAAGAASSGVATSGTPQPGHCGAPGKPCRAAATGIGAGRAPRWRRLLGATCNSHSSTSLPPAELAVSCARRPTYIPHITAVMQGRGELHGDRQRAETSLPSPLRCGAASEIGHVADLLSHDKGAHAQGHS